MRSTSSTRSRRWNGLERTFACGTAAVITQIGQLVTENDRIVTPEIEGEAISAKLRKRLVENAGLTFEVES